MSSPSTGLPPLGPSAPRTPLGGPVNPPSPLSRNSSASVYDFNNDSAISKMISLAAWFGEVISYANIGSSESLQEIGVLVDTCPDENLCSELIAAMKLAASTKQFNKDLKVLATTTLKNIYPDVTILSPGRVARPPSTDPNAF